MPKNIKKTLFVSGTYILLLTILLIGITVARYQDVRIAYSSFGAATFNAVILGDNTIEAMTDSENPVVNKFGANLQTTNYRPGMTWSEDPDQNTAEVFTFTVANGTSQANASQVPVEYSLTLRTSGNLPLKYSLQCWIPDEQAEAGGYYQMFSAGDAVVSDGTAEGTGKWYEYHFLDENQDEALFSIQGSQLALNKHNLILEWPVLSPTDELSTDESTGSTKYMKEVELIEFVATVSSKNMLKDEAYKNTEPVVQRTFTSGVIILDPADQTVDPGLATASDADLDESAESGVEDYRYELDYRAFQNDASDNSRRFTLRIENGVGKGRNQQRDYIYYDASLKVPVNEDTEGLLYSVKKSGGAEADFQELMNPEYRLYDELDGSYVVCASLEDRPEGKEDTTQYCMYAVYPFIQGDCIYNKTINTATGEAELSYGAADYVIRITSEDGEPILDGKLSNIGFANKLEVLIQADFTDTLRDQE